MKWYDVKVKTPPTNRMLLVCRALRIASIGHSVFIHDIGTLEGTSPSDRWHLQSQLYSPLPCEPTLASGYITHWAFLPELPEVKDKEA